MEEEAGKRLGEKTGEDCRQKGGRRRSILIFFFIYISKLWSPFSSKT